MALMFPGQGSHVPGSLQFLANVPAVQSVLSDVDLLLDPNSPILSELVANQALRLQFAMYANAVALGFSVIGRVPANSILIGHSLGEIAALTVAGAWNVADGARIVCARTVAVQETVAQGGGLAAINLGLERAEHLLAAMGSSELAIAAANAPRQTVVSGQHDALKRLAMLANALDVPCTVLASPFPFHHPALYGAAERFVTIQKDIVTRQPARRVLSPIDGTFYDNPEEVIARLARHFVRPVLFANAIRRLHAWGTDRFIECGAPAILTALVRQNAPDIQSVTAREFLGTFTDSHASNGPYVDVVNSHSFGMTAPMHGHQGVSSFASAHDLASQPEAVRIEVAPLENVRSTEADSVLATLRSLYAEWLEYPETVLTPTADLEADLGIDSLKQTELLGKVFSHYKVSGIPDDFRVSDFPTLAAVTSYLQNHIAKAAAS
jgi:acyl transferase domain-containing protein/acyl carrier protein